MRVDGAYDAVVIGAGHNGLVCAAYLAKAGLAVKVVERRGVVGGAAVTEEFHPGFRNSVCAYTVGLLAASVADDLRLKEFGLQLVERPLSNFMPLDNGDYIKRPSNQAAFKAEIARFSQEDADNLADYEATLDRLAAVLRGLVLETPPNAGGGWREMWRAWRSSRPVRRLPAADQAALADIMVLSAAEFLGRWFRHDAVRALIAFDAVVGTMAGPHTPGTAYVLLHHCFGDIMGRPGVWGHAIGGMGALTQAMARAAEAAGAEIETNAPVAEVVVENGQAAGVRLEDGRRIRARAVAANVTPSVLLTQLLDARHLDAATRRLAETRRYGSGTFRMNVALAELPDFTCLPGREAGEHHGAGIILAPSIGYMEQAHRDAVELGWSRRPIVEMLIPSTIDPTLAPEGRHVASLFCQHFNPVLPGGRSWDEARDEAADAVLDTVNAFAPNFRDSVLGRQVLSPLDLEREFGLTGGDIFHGCLDLNQLFSLRPMLGHADYRMPVGGLYLCGAGAHPGGGVTGAPGHNAAREMVRDL